jgi:murein tripeptide amidase MpaA
MVNVDGVYYGNYRTNLSGADLNRIWKQPRKDFHPEINSIKKYLYNANRMT